MFFHPIVNPNILTLTLPLFVPSGSQAEIPPGLPAPPTGFSAARWYGRSTPSLEHRSTLKQREDQEINQSSSHQIKQRMVHSAVLEDHVTYKHSSFSQALFVFHVFEDNPYYLEKRVINVKSSLPANLTTPGNCLYARKRISNPLVFILCDRGLLALDRLHLSSQQRNAAARPVLTGNIKYIYIYMRITWHSTPQRCTNARYGIL